MPDHPRKIIRQGLATRLATKKSDDTYWTNAGASAFSTKPDAIDPSDMPCIIVRSLEENVEVTGVTEFCTFQRRSLVLSVDGMIEALDNLEDVLDDLAEGIESAFDSYQIVGVEDAKIQLNKTEFDLQTNAEIPFGTVLMEYLVTYHVKKEGVDYGNVSPTSPLNKECDKDPNATCVDPVNVTTLIAEINREYDPNDLPEPAIETLIP